MTNTKEGNAKLNGYTSFIRMNLKLEKGQRQISIRLTLKNVSEKEDIRNAKILLFAFDKNGMVLIPENRKTPELICVWKRDLTPGKSKTCLIETTHYLQDIQEVKPHSFSVTGEDGQRYLLTDKELEEMYEIES